MFHNRNEFLAQYRYMVETFHLSEGRWPVVQEFLPGEAAGVCVLYQNGRYVAGFAERYLRCKEPGRFGTSTLREPFNDKQLISRAISVMDKLKWHGVAHLDFVADKDRRLKINRDKSSPVRGAGTVRILRGRFSLFVVSYCNGRISRKTEPVGIPADKMQVDSWRLYGIYGAC